VKRRRRKNQPDQQTSQLQRCADDRRELFQDAALPPDGGKIYRMLLMRRCGWRHRNSKTGTATLYQETNAKFVRKRRMDLVHKELKYFKENFQLEYAYFWADTFLALNKREFDEFCEMYYDIRLPFWMQTRPETISHDNIRRLADVGLHRISFGIEHGNEGFRARLLDRRWKNPDIIEALKIPHQYGIQFSVNNITGFPTETRELAMDTVELNRQIQADNANLYSFTPFHGTPLRKLCEDMGLIDPDTITKCATDKAGVRAVQYPIRDYGRINVSCSTLAFEIAGRRSTKPRQIRLKGNRIFNELSKNILSATRCGERCQPARQPWSADLEYGGHGSDLKQ
jgi:hypothetical protein